MPESPCQGDSKRGSYTTVRKDGKVSFLGVVRRPAKTNTGNSVFSGSGILL